MSAVHNGLPVTNGPTMANLSRALFTEQSIGIQREVSFTVTESRETIVMAVESIGHGHGKNSFIVHGTVKGKEFIYVGNTESCTGTLYRN